MTPTKNDRFYQIDPKNIINDTITRAAYKGAVIHTALCLAQDDERQWVYDIDRWHRDKAINADWGPEWQGIWYDFVIERNGNAYITHLALNGIERVHVAENPPAELGLVTNRDFAGICLAGNGTKQRITIKQLNMTCEILRALAVNNDMTEKVHPHSGFSEKKTCPGYFVQKYFGWFHNAIEDGNKIRMKF